MLADKNGYQSEYEINISAVLSFESNLIMNSLFIQKMKKINSLRFMGSIHELYEKVKCNEEFLIIDYITQSFDYDYNNEVIKASIMKEVIYNIKNAIISVETISENKYDVRIRFKDKNDSLILEYETYWKRGEVFWYDQFIKKLQEDNDK